MLYVVKNSAGHMMNVILLPATPPYTAMFNENVTIDRATTYETKEEALQDILDLIIYNDEPASKFEGFKIEEI